MPARTSVWNVTARLLVALLLCSTLLAAGKQKPLTNDDVIKMAKAGLDDDVIISTVQANANAFDLSPDGLIALKKGGVNSKVLHAMQALGRQMRILERRQRQHRRHQHRRKTVARKTPVTRKTRTVVRLPVPIMTRSPTGK